ncbi:DoxX family protein [Glycomyces xiaoerkulensis]|uniref:DoxX family protein n=1 Tax=Glycomyces xiaoerkulensis TaxID=2038139 RepID=UPI000C2658B1|nr:DoxX family protein [Glycomyces xiaoerkulensis]
MFTATVVLTVILALLMGNSGIGKFRRQALMMDTLEEVGAARIADPLGILEIAGAIGLLAGLFWWPIGVAAAIGSALYFIGAVIAHLRVGHRQGTPLPTLLALAAIAILVLRLLTA